MTLPAILPDWMPWWAQMLLWLAAVVVGIAWVIAPFIVIGLRGRLAYATEQLDEVQAQLRMIAQRMPEPISAARYEALRSAMAREAAPDVAPGAVVTRGTPGDTAYRMPPQRAAAPRPPEPYPEPYPEPDETSWREPPAPPATPAPDSAYRPTLPPRPPLARPAPAPDDAYGHDDYQRRLSSPPRSQRPPEPDRGDAPRHEPRLRWPPRES